MVIGELGIYPVGLEIRRRMVGFWSRLLAGKSTKIARHFCLLQCALLEEGPSNRLKWAKMIKEILQTCGFNDIWLGKVWSTTTWLKIQLKMRLYDQFKQNWLTSNQDSTKCDFYKIFKTSLELEPYLQLNLSNFAKNQLMKFPLSNQSLLIEAGRWAAVERNKRICPLCVSNTLGDETHYLFSCSFFIDEREKYLPNTGKQETNIDEKICNLFSSSDIKNLENLAYFCSIIMEAFK